MGEEAKPYRSLRQRLGLDQLGTGTSSSSTAPAPGDLNVFQNVIIQD